MFDEMEQMMDGMRRSMYGGMDSVRSRTGGMDANMTLERTDDGYVVLADLPGFEKEEIDLRFEDGHLTVEASHESAHDSEFGSMSRSRMVSESIRVPGDVVEDEIEATYRNGVLETILPVADSEERDDTRQIDIGE